MFCPTLRITRLHVEPLEDRLLMHFDAPDSGDDSDNAHDELDLPLIGYTRMAPEDSRISQQVIEIGPLAALTDIPLLHSNSGATVKLYLDFNGHFESNWGGYSNITTPVFDRDGDATTFSQSELNEISEIWQRVSEDFAPFDVDVTTEEPPDFSDGVAMRASIGGDGSWIGPYGGVAYVNTFTYGSIANTVYIFSDNLYNGRYTAEATSHESGHGFGLWHQSSYDGSGNKTAEYYAGGSGWAPIMGNSYYQTITTWHDGTNNLSSTTYQDDMAIMARDANGFGYRADDHGGSTATATSLGISGTVISDSGLIAENSDTDWFSFTTGSGQIVLTVDVATVGANLDAVIELRDSNGNVIASADPTASQNATVIANVSAGDYFLVVRSNGNYGHVGTYTISGNLAGLPAGFTLNGTELVIQGGSGNDELRMVAGASYYITLNGVTTALSADRVTSIVFDGGSGYNRTFFSDTQSVWLSAQGADSGVLLSARYYVSVSNVALIIVWDNAASESVFYDVFSGGGDLGRFGGQDDAASSHGDRPVSQRLEDRSNDDDDLNHRETGQVTAAGASSTATSSATMSLGRVQAHDQLFTSSAGRRSSTGGRHTALLIDAALRSADHWRVPEATFFSRRSRLAG